MSENIFSNFYNKVLSFFQKDKEDNSESAKDTATNRLKLVLMQDRSNLDGATMQKMREQLICVISKYIEIDQEALDLNLEADGDEIALMLNIPVIRARTREEIEELEKQERLEQEKAIEKSDSETMKIVRSVTKTNKTLRKNLITLNRMKKKIKQRNLKNLKITKMLKTGMNQKKLKLQQKNLIIIQILMKRKNLRKQKINNLLYCFY